jgi:NhaP-type Na+/H+ or K+/H+ antiporter
VLANLKNTDIDDILDFKESLSLLLISGLFIILAARVEFYQFKEIGWHALGILAVMMLVTRPPGCLDLNIQIRLKTCRKTITFMDWA